MKGFFNGALLLGTVLVSSLSSAADLTLMSWNAMRLGQGGEKSFPALAEVAGKADLVAIQEVMNEEGLTKLEAELEKRTGEQWSTLVSHV
ncbi:hypothetical protein [Pseudomonas aeruginosa]|uniref:hypothetical protein n=1 Tax=Pseudomonas aeruginosa TaxID=287 RepID=UPI00211A3F03|nr:hypothetical protein [Pseudomonas aeruginosa]